MRTLLSMLGAILVLFGGFFALQGAGIIMWPAESFMLAAPQWILYGAVIAAVGVLLLWWANRRRA